MSLKSIFISSTYKDLVEYRKAVWNMLPTFNVEVRGMEKFGARTTSPRETCLAEVEQSDVYVGIVAFRLGSLDPETKRTFTELEYERAIETKKEILIYIAEEDTAFPANVIDTGTREVTRIATFKKLLRERHTVATFSSAKDLIDKLQIDFEKFFEEADPGASTGLAAEFEKSTKMIQEFRLTPARFNGKEVRLTVMFVSGPYAAGRELCRRFNLEYGSTIGMWVRITNPNEKGLCDGLTELYATGNLVDTLRQMRVDKNGEIYASLRFCEDDVKRARAEFFGVSYYPWEEPNDDDGSVYVPPEGKVIMLFSKPA